MRKYITIFLCFLSVALLGQQEINLSKIPFETESIGKKLKDVFVKYQKLAASKSNCSDEYSNVMEPFQVIDGYCDKNISYEELKKVLQNLRAIDKIKSDNPTCFGEDFKTYQDVIRNTYQTVIETENKNLKEKERVNTRKREESSDSGLFSWYWLLLIAVLVAAGFLTKKRYEEEQAAAERINKPRSPTQEFSQNREKITKNEPITPKESENKKGPSAHEQAVEKEKKEKAEKDQVAKEKQATEKENARKEDAKREEIKQQKEQERFEAEQLENQKNQEARLLESQQLENQRLESERKAQEKTEIYISIPSGEMAFSNNPILRYTHGRTFYHFWITNDNKAEFEFCNEATPFAIDQPQTHIIPACTPRNTRENYTTGIKTLKKGTAHLEEDKWVVDQKAEIEYLY